MSKYAPLTDFLKGQKLDQSRVKFRDLEKILGFALPSSSKTHRAWWSNNPGNNVMTKAWLAAGWRTQQVDLEGETLVFVRDDLRRAADKKPASGPAPSPSPVPFDLFGALRGTVTIHGDILEPIDVEWNAEKGIL